MSVTLMDKVWKIELPPGEKLVLLALADRANDDGTNCWPSVETIARQSGQSVRTVRRALSSLEDAGHLTRSHRDGTSSTYHVHPCHCVTPATVSPVTKTTVTPATVSPKPSRTTKKDLSNDKSQRARAECDRVVVLWNAMAKTVDLAACLKMTGKRAKACQARIRDDGLGAIQMAIEHIPKSSFLRGETGNWTGANIDFLLRPDTITKILEGNYDDRQPKPSGNRNSIAAALDRKIGLVEPTGTAERRTISDGSGDIGGPVAYLAAVR